MSSPEKLIIETPEQTSLDFPLAGVGSRFLAIAVDTAIQFMALAAVFIPVVLVVPVLRSVGLIFSAQWGLALWILGVFVVDSGYFAFFEAVWNGQTPGKRFAQIRVIKDDGRPISVYDAVARNLLRAVDVLPAMYVVGICSILFSRQNKRLGDYVAGTVVVHEKAIEGIRARRTAGSAPALPAIDASRLTADEVGLIETFFSRCESLEPALRASMAGQISARIAAKLNVQASGWPQREAFLAAVLDQYRSAARFRSR
jgi:uncharacterized RDD family membrane protein YckC